MENVATSSRPVAGGYNNNPAGANGRRIMIRLKFTQRALEPAEIEERTSINYMGERLPFWKAVRSVIEAAFYEWGFIRDRNARGYALAALAVNTRFKGEIWFMVDTLLSRPLEPKARARIHQIAKNAIDTLDRCLALLIENRPPTKALSQEEIILDWAVGGIQRWSSSYPSGIEFEGKVDGLSFEPTSGYGNTKRTADEAVTHQHIANIYRVDHRVIAELERKALLGLRETFAEGSALPATRELLA